MALRLRAWRGQRGSESHRSTRAIASTPRERAKLPQAHHRAQRCLSVLRGSVCRSRPPPIPWCYAPTPVPPIMKTMDRLVRESQSMPRCSSWPMSHLAARPRISPTRPAVCGLRAGTSTQRQQGRRRRRPAPRTASSARRRRTGTCSRRRRSPALAESSPAAQAGSGPTVKRAAS
eukprot:COSAG01_NODE_14630_length_1429_cov_1.571429_1_plen_175_part_00